MSNRFSRLVVITAMALVTAPVAVSPASGAPDVGTQAITFADEFNGPAGTPVDGNKWRVETGNNGGNNREYQYYTTRTQNVAMDGQGNLVITARRENPGNYNCWYGRCQYTSARLNTSGKFSQTYGHFEIRMKMSHGQGMWPAFWMMGTTGGGWPNNGEIDVMENIGREPNTVHGTIHGPGYSGAGGIGAGFTGPRFADGFHTFRLDWAPNSLVWSVDNRVFQRRTPADLGGRQWVFNNRPFYMLLNLAVGGDWPGAPNAGTPMPNTIVIDYVRVTTL
ncbi:family 16 glycosylhydrolase [Lentzea sp. NPDC051213]|uniref:glycoside hydrolase family 16 protein n=1 Tax=Lentzea sp. NPDC051213 TaxID=3364126 RepID=UPI0037B5A1F1